MVEAAAWPVREESGHQSEKKMTKPKSWGLKTSLDAAAAFFWERLVGVEEDEEFNSMKPKIEQYYQRHYYCETLRCRFHAIQDGAIDLLLDSVTDPIGTWRRWREAVGRMSVDGFPFVNELLGVLILYALLNMVSMTVLRFEKMVTLLLELGYLFFSAPFCVLSWKIGACCWKYAAAKAKNIRKAAKVQRRKYVKELREEAAAEATVEKEASEAEDKEEEAEEKEDESASKEMVVANAGVSDDVLQRALMGMMSHWLATAATAGADATHPAGRSDMRSTRCDYCGGQGHVTANCWTKTRDQERRSGEAAKKGGWNNGGQRQLQYRQVRNIEETEAEVEGESSGSFTCNALDNEAGKLMYVPVMLNGGKVDTCMIDTGAEINVISADLARKHGLTYKPALIREIRGFNGVPTPVVGMATCAMEMAPSEKKCEEKFLVVDVITGGPIIGMPTLTRFGLILDCDSREITDKASGHTVKCAVMRANFQKN